MVIKRLDLEDPEEVKLIEKLQEDMLEHKMTSEALKNQLSEVMKEHKRQSEIQEELIRKQEEMAKKQ